jgi:hypothetical protein
VRIHHRIPGFPGSVQFKPLRVPVADVLAQLHQMGYPKN